MKEFQTLISEAQEHIKSIEKEIGNLISIKTRVHEAVGKEEIEVTNKISVIVNNVNNSKNKMDTIIKNLKSDLDQGKEKDEYDTDLRLKKNLFDAMIKKYLHTMQRFHDEENEVKNNKEKKLVRQAEIALGQDLDEQERKEVIENPQMVQQIYEDRLKQPAHQKLINAVKDLEERHQDIKRLAKSLQDLHKMIIQLNLLVQYQGEMIDNIVDNVNKAKDHIIKGEKAVVDSRNNMQKKRKMKCIIMFIVVGALLIILIPIFIKFL